ncbi:toxin YdaT family protein [Escherichia coli]|uniref:toxin YdaT family protein n=1 Tax=Escherichia coli TaxID=562 RepID=UPI003D983F73
MKIKHEHIRMAMNVWAHPDGEKVPAAKITKAYFELGMTFPELYDDSHPEALARNTQKIFRWLDKDTPDAVEKMQALLPKENGSWLYLIDLEHALRVAGIRIKGEEHGNKTRG